MTIENGDLIGAPLSTGRNDIPTAFRPTRSTLAITAITGPVVANSLVLTGPNPPSILQGLTSTPLGYQFSFNQVVPLKGQTISAYRVYKNTVSNAFTGAQLLRTFAHDATHQGAIVVQDNVGANKSYYYFVTAVNSAGLESSSVAAQGAAVLSGAVNTFNATPVNVSGMSTSSGAILTQSGTSTTIDIAAFTVQYGNGQVSYNSGSVNPGAYGQYVIYFSDATYAGGSPTYLYSTVGYTIVSAEGYVVIGSITTSSSGGGSGGGGGTAPCFLSNVKLADGEKISEHESGDLILTKRGIRAIKQMVVRDYKGLIYHMGNDEWVTAQHHFVLGNTQKQAYEIFHEMKYYAGPVWNLEIETEDEEERNYFLENGMLSHNYLPLKPC